MKSLFIFPPYPVKLVEAIVPPLGLLYMVTYLRKHNFAAELIDCTPSGLDITDVEKIIRKKDPDIVAVSATTPIIKNAIEIMKIAKHNNPGIKTILGGPHASALYNKILERHPEIDIIIRGEGEVTILELFKELEKSKPELRKVKGVSFRLDGRIIHNERRELIVDLDKLPFPDRTLIDKCKYRPSIKWFNRMPFTTMMTSRGCPYNCLFCDSHITWGRKTRFRSAENVVEEIRFLVDNLGIKEIIFYDDTFTVNKKRVESICNLIRKERLDITWGCLTRVDSIDESITNKMKKAGCHIMSFGIESGSEKMLKIMRKNINLRQAVEAMRIVNRAKIDGAATFVFGIPGETKETMQQTINFAKRLDPDYAIFFRAVPFPGTDLYYEAKRQDIIYNFDWETYTEVQDIPLLKIASMSEKEFSTLIKKAYTQFYLRPRKMMGYIQKMTSLKKIKYYTGVFKSFFKLI